MLRSRLSRQSGAFSILAAGTLLLALSCLVLVLDSGRLYLEQRKLQKLADIAALESIARLEQGRCFSAPELAQSYAEENAQLNGFSTSNLQSLTTGCVNLTTPTGVKIPEISPAGNAVQATAQETVPASLLLRAGSLFGLNVDDTVTLQAQAVAEREEPMAAFSIGAQLLNVNSDGLLGRVASGVGLNINNLIVLDSDGLVNISITPAGLLKALGVNLSIHELKVLTPKALLEQLHTEVGIITAGNILTASAQLVSDSALASDLKILGNDVFKSDIGDIAINLFGTEDNPGLFRMSTQDSAGAALTTAVNLGELLKTTILIGAQGRGLVVPDLEILGLARVELGVVEPPSIAVGPVGTTAYNAQVRAYIDIDSESSLLGGLLPGELVNIQLPLWIDVTTAEASFDQAICKKAPPEADMFVTSTIVNVCLGNIPEENKWSQTQGCEAGLEEVDIVTMLGSSIPGSDHIEGLSYSETLEGVLAGQSRYSGPNNLAVGSTVDNIVQGLKEDVIDIINSDSSQELLGGLLGGLLGTVSTVLDGLVDLITPILDTVGANILTPLLSDLLGSDAGMGKSYLELYELNCGPPRLVH
ncbi:pilus assembly protein TadG-related protein [Zobellella maritima]|uniref:pilus assembly protein TadG-related protein n=1 Tax=Zobellella maritima TaxID=2059725 RepID=UPI0018E506E9|nr:pilus assembly protein TadG-related protein [Zobellella maritima]